MGMIVINEGSLDVSKILFERLLVTFLVFYIQLTVEIFCFPGLKGALLLSFCWNKRTLF